MIKCLLRVLFKFFYVVGNIEMFVFEVIVVVGFFKLNYLFYDRDLVGFWIIK